MAEAIERDSGGKSGEAVEGIRITRAGGAVCDEDPSQLMGLTIDIWCNPDVTGSPSQIEAP